MTGIQQEMKFTAPTSIREMVLEAMADGGWWRLEQLAYYCMNRYGKMTSDATISARLRELSAQGFPHETRPRGNGSHAVEYRRVA
jgi:hypothetical protein